MNRLKKGVWIALTGLLFSLVYSGCKKDEASTGPGGSQYTGPVGTVVGKILAANGVTPVQGVSVTVQSTFTNMPTAVTDTGGNYTLAGVPTGAQTLIAKKGLFQVTISVSVTQNQTTIAPPAQLQSTGLLGYVTGAFDHIENIVRDSLNYPMQQVSADSLGVASVIARYRAIFLNCGMDLSFLDSAAAATLRNYVAAGGSLYISDLAQDIVRQMFPADVFNFDAGNQQTIFGRVVDAQLRAFVAKDSVQILYNLGGWETLDSLSSRPVVLLRGDYMTSTLQRNKALAIIIQHGNGRVVYTTFHNTANITTDAVKVLTFFLFSL